MDWFERLTGFVETDHAVTRARLEVTDGRRLVSLVNGESYRTGHLELVSLAELRDRLKASARSESAGRSKTVLLTSLGGGAFGNHESWIEAGLVRALELASGFELDVRLVSYGEPPWSFVRIEQMFA